jgi:hypothetical protein
VAALQSPAADPARAACKRAAAIRDQRWIVQQASDSSGDVTEYCVKLGWWDSGSFTLAASDFSRNCWDHKGDEVWDGTRAVSLEVMVPSSYYEWRDFDLCIQSVTFEGTE